MFEEVPRERRRLSQLPARRIAFGPFVLGGGVLLATLGGSVAVAATVITAGTIAVHDSATARRSPIIPPSRVNGPVSAPGSATRPAGPAVLPWSGERSGDQASPTPSSSSTARVRSTATLAPAVPGGGADARPGAAAPSTPARSGSLVAPDAAPSAATPSPSGSGPSGNALVYVTGYDRITDRLTYRYASVSPGTGPGHSDVYTVGGQTVYFAGLAADLTIRSGGAICEPPGGFCTPSQLVTAASNGFFAEVAVDPSGLLHSIIERDNVRYGTGPAPVTSPAPGPSGPGAASAAVTVSPSPSPSVS